MKIKDLIDKLANNSEFIAWKESHKDTLLAHIFFICDNPTLINYDIGYYTADNNRMTTFLVSGDDIKINSDQEIFKDPTHPILELDLSKINLEFEEAIGLASALQQEKYSADLPMKKFVILQHIKQGLVWNVTFMTQSLKTLNIKIDAESKEIVEHKATSMMDFTAN
ncbi:hypothetical protein HN587_05285 [Candidatus Woesearchaeota archaeon]|jgi:hypothetical protein|nr:hypothetical protein [Candidatus Woesearchaeota archaeon]